MVSNTSVVISKQRGTLYDDGPLGVELINNQKDFKDFIDSIAAQLPHYVSKGKGKPHIDWVDNTADLFLNGKLVPDFSKEIVIVFRGAEIDQVNYNSSTKNYEVTFNSQQNSEMNYFSAVCQRHADSTFLIEYKNERPMPYIEQRASLSRPMQFIPID